MWGGTEGAWGRLRSCSLVLRLSTRKPGVLWKPGAHVLEVGREEEAEGGPHLVPSG